MPDVQNSLNILRRLRRSDRVLVRLGRRVDTPDLGREHARTMAYPTTLRRVFQELHEIHTAIQKNSIELSHPMTYEPLTDCVVRRSRLHHLERSR